MAQAADMRTGVFEYLVVRTMLCELFLLRKSLGTKAAPIDYT